MNRRKRLVQVALALGCLTSLGGIGCSSAISGAYDGGAMPEGSEFHIARATFKDDKTFTAYAKRPGTEGQVVNGSYAFNGFKLELKQAGKEARVYNATYNSFSRTLELSDGKGAKQTLKRM